MMKKHPVCQPQTRTTKVAGFTLIELLVSVVILAIGLLGTLAMQARALNDNQDAYMRSQAILLAYDLSDRMRANPNGWTAVPGAGNGGCNEAGANCTVAQMAQYDLWNWQNDIAEKLTDGAGSVVFQGNMCSGAAATGLRIQITWKRANTDANSRMGNACYSLDVVLRT